MPLLLFFLVFPFSLFSSYVSPWDHHVVDQEGLDVRFSTNHLDEFSAIFSLSDANRRALSLSLHGFASQTDVVRGILQGDAFDRSSWTKHHIFGVSLRERMAFANWDYDVRVGYWQGFFSRFFLFGLTPLVGPSWVRFGTHFLKLHQNSFFAPSFLTFPTDFEGLAFFALIKGKIADEFSYDLQLGCFPFFVFQMDDPNERVRLEHFAFQTNLIYLLSDFFYHWNQMSVGFGLNLFSIQILESPQRMAFFSTTFRWRHS